jgi:hypothetical protein
MEGGYTREPGVRNGCRRFGVRAGGESCHSVNLQGWLGWAHRIAHEMDAKSCSVFAIAWLLSSGCANVCESVGAATATVVPAGKSSHATIALRAPPPDPAHPAHIIAYRWSSTSGAIDTPDSLNATLTCGKPGPVEVNIRITDGVCEQSKTLSLVCPGDAPSSVRGQDAG